MLDEGWLGAARRLAAPRALSRLLLCLVGVTWGPPALGLEPREVPEPLRPWLPWVLEQLGDSVCPILAGEPACVWPGRLALELDERGGRFRLNVHVDRRMRVPLPGGDEQWPQSVQVDGRAALVMEEGGAPVVTLEAGQHALEGRFVWKRLPETLVVPARIALLELSVGGQPAAQPKRDGERVWLKGERVSAEEPESLTLEVFRRLEDQLPFLVHTELVLQVSGRSRELRIPTALTPGALPIELGSKLPARIEPNGELFLQIYPGRHEIWIDALYPAPPDRLSAPRHAPPGPAQEIWVFVPHTEHRQTEIKGGLSIDPQRTNLPEAWRGGFATYQLEGGSELSFSTLRRGQPQPPPNRLSVERELWLDLDGQGYTVRDRLSGSMERNWRIDLLRGELGHLRQLFLLVLTLVFIGFLFSAVYHSLLGTPNMEVAGSGSSERLLHWYLDRSTGELPVVWVLNVSLWVWRAVMLLWALWLAHSLVRWL